MLRLLRNTSPQMHLWASVSEQPKHEVQLHLLYITSCCMVAAMKIDLK